MTPRKKMRVMPEGEAVKQFEADGVSTLFRYPRWSDLDAFVQLHATLTREKVMARRLRLDRLSGGRMLADILVAVAESKRSYLLVEREGAVVGEGFTADVGGHGYCEVGLALIGRVRGIGIGTQLMWTLEDEARRLGIGRLYLTAWSANPIALRVYRKVGYQECGRRPGWIRVDSGGECDLVEMVKILQGT